MVDDKLIVSGCRLPRVTKYIQGVHAKDGLNHGKPVHKKVSQEDGVDSLAYFWDSCDGQKYEGWWIGPVLMGNTIWATSEHAETNQPPSTLWRVPHDGPVDPHLMLFRAPEQPMQSPLDPTLQLGQAPDTQKNEEARPSQ